VSDTRARDLALIALAGVLAMTGMICITLLAHWGTVDAAVAISGVGAGFALGGVALGRLSGTSAPSPG
jgi:hypothetical protein